MKDRNTEIREAIEAGNRALEALDEAMGHLKTARGLGVWDMLGGGFLSSLLKHSKMDDAQQAMQYAQQELQDQIVRAQENVAEARRRVWEAVQQLRFLIGA